MNSKLQRTKVAVRTAADMLDGYDKTGRAFGCFLGRELAGAVRLVIVDGPERLPSYSFSSHRFSHWRAGRMAEVSRLVVRRPYCHLGIATRLVVRTLRSAVQLGIRNILAAAADCPGTIRFWEELGFRVVRENFCFESSQMTYPNPMAAFWLDSQRPPRFPAAKAMDSTHSSNNLR